MELSLYREDLLNKYKSPSQRIRVLSESWCLNQMYCPACPSPIIKSYSNNEKVKDFFCPECGEFYQLKSQSVPFKSRVVDGAYGVMMEAIHTGAIPNFLFLYYSKTDYSIQNMLLVPRFFFSESIIEKRKPLSDTARRAGWVGCNILFGNLAEEGKIKVIEKNAALSAEGVRESWDKVGFLKETKPQSKDWINDIMWCIGQLDKKEFTLKELSAYERHLKVLHPDNNNIVPKIRQQLQFLRDKDYLRFVGKGQYELIGG